MFPEIAKLLKDKFLKRYDWFSQRTETVFQNEKNVKEQMEILTRPVSKNFDRRLASDLEEKKKKLE